jgi:hypothetical protein
MIWSELLADIRADLQDTGTTPRWSDKTLFVYVKDAVRDYSIWFPKREDALEIAPLNGAYPLPVDYIEDIQVECPIGSLLERRQNRPGVHYRTTSVPLSYFVSGGKMYLSSPAADAVYLTYFATHGLPTSESDSTFAFTVPDMDVELVRLYVKAQVYGQMRARQAALDRFKVGSGTRTDNPLMPETQDLMEEYHRKIAERIQGGVITLYRRGAQR